MSWYYDFYIGYIDKIDGKVYPYGPYVNSDGKEKIQSIMNYSRSYSRSFDYDFSDEFWEINSEKYSDELKKEKSFKYYLKGISEDPCTPMKYCKLSELGSENFVKSGYFLIEQVRAYQEDHDPDNLYGAIDPVTYNGMVDSELKFGKPAPKKDEGGYEYQPESASDYMYFAYPDYHCKEWRTFQIQLFANAIIRYEDRNDENKEFVILMTEG